MNQIRSKQELYGFILLTCLCLVLNGCGGEKLPDNMPKPCPTVITITQDGQPLADASVVLVPMDPSNTWHAGATTNASGNAILQTHVKYDGVVPGKYFIIVSKFEPPQGDNIGAPDAATDPEGYQRYLDASAKKTGAGYDLVDLKFSKASSDVTIEVVAVTRACLH